MKKAAIILFAFVGSSAMAASDQQQQQTQKPMTFAQLQESCLTPAKFQNQVAPTNISISCREQQTNWVPTESGAVGMKNARQVSVSVVSDKYTVGYEIKDLVATSQSAACPKFKQTIETVEVVRSLGCEELSVFQGSGVDFCDQAATNLRKDNPTASTVEDTG
jgi:hypothetical protein